MPALMRTWSIVNVCHCSVGEIQRLIRHDAEVVKNVWLEFAIAVSPVNIEQWKTSGLLSRLYAVFKASWFSVWVDHSVMLSVFDESGVNLGQVRFPRQKVSAELTYLSGVSLG